MDKKTSKVFFAPILISLVLVLLITSPVFADDGQTTEVVETTPVVLETEAPAQTETSVVLATEVPTDVPAETYAAVETTVPTEVPTEVVSADPTEVATEVPTQEASLAEVVSALAESDVDLVTSSGSSVDLASNASSTALTAADPYFTVGTTTYRFMTFGSGGCDAYTTNCFYAEDGQSAVQAALDYISTNPTKVPTDKKIYIQAGTYNGDVVVNGSLAGVKSLTALVGDLAEGETNADIILSGSVYITNMVSGFSISNLTVKNLIDKNDAAIMVTNSKGTITLTNVTAQAAGEDSVGILIDHNGKVVLNQVTANNNGYNGARIYNTGTVTITNGSFNGNNTSVSDGLETYDERDDLKVSLSAQTPFYAGLYINTPAAVSLYGVSASDNVGHGAYIFTNYKGAVSVKGSSFGQDSAITNSLGDFGDGLRVYGNTVTVENVLAQNDGIRGIFALAKLSFTGTRIQVQNNASAGLSVDTCLLNGGTTCTNNAAATTTVPLPGFVTVLDSSSHTNGISGFFVRARGDITFTDVYTDGNGGDGFYLNNSFGPSVSAVTLKDVTGKFSYNGFEIFSKGAVSITNLVATNNILDGLYIDNRFGTGSVTITNAANTFNTTSDNGDDGYDIWSRGKVFIANLDASGNTDYGGYVDNTAAATSVSVTLTLVPLSNGFTNGYENNRVGLKISSNGAVSLTNVYVAKNEIGALIFNIHSGNLPVGAVKIVKSGFIQNSSGNGLEIISKGAVSLSSVTANNNENSMGIFISTHGAVTLTNVNARDNNSGITINNVPSGTTTGAAVTFTTGSVSFNKNNGLTITSKGAVTLQDVQTDNNSANYYSITNGVEWTDNLNDDQTWYYSGTEGEKLNIIITSDNFTPNVWINNASGTTIANINGSDGAVTLSYTLDSTERYSINVGTQAEYRLWTYQIKLYVGETPPTQYTNKKIDSYGVVINNTYGTNAPVSIVNTTSLWSSNNSGNNLKIDSNGAVTLANFQLNDSGSNGLLINNSTSTGKAGVTLTNIQINNNNLNGLTINSLGLISITNMQAEGNYGYGFKLNNAYTGATSGVTIKNSKDLRNTANGNGDYGYNITTNGAVSIINLEATKNGGYGGLIDNSSSLKAQAVSLTESFTSEDEYLQYGFNNGGNGLEIKSNGAVTLSRLGVLENKGIGVKIYNIPSGTLAVGAVIFNKSYSSNNTQQGLFIESKGQVTLVRNENKGNGTSGAYDGTYINNQITGSTGGVTIKTDGTTGNSFSYNSGTGLRILSNGAVDLDNILVINNGSNGLVIDNGLLGKPVTIKQSTSNFCGYEFCTEGNAFSNNGSTGLSINSTGAVSVSFFQAKNNLGTGILIDADGGSGAVILTGRSSNYADNVAWNSNDGITISAKGNIALSYIAANFNYYNDFYDNTGIFKYGAAITNETGTGSVTLLNAYFNNNDRGLTVTSNGAFTWTNGSANNNLHQGADFNKARQFSDQTGAAVKITNVEACSNGQTGLLVISKGVITLLNVTANNNSVNRYLISYNQVWTDNITEGQVWWVKGTGEEVVISVTGTNFNPTIYLTDIDGNRIGSEVVGTDNTATLTYTLTNSTNYKVYVTGNKVGEYKISLNRSGDVATDGNMIYAANGIFVNNYYGTNVGVSITNTKQTWNGNNSSQNVSVQSSGSVVLSNQDLNDSRSGGLYVYNSNSATNPGVTLTNVNFNMNLGTAADIHSKGAVVIKNAELTDNLSYGYNIDNNDGTVLSPVSITNVTINGWLNPNDNLKIVSNGSVTLNSVTINGHFGSGINIATKGLVTFSTVNSNDNKSTGIVVDTDGDIIFTDVNASNNGGYGADIDAVGAVTLTNVQTNNNIDSGLDIDTTGSVIFTGVRTSYNSGNGAVVVTPSTFTFVNTNDRYGVCTGNQLDGLSVTAGGKIVITKARASANTQNGIRINSTNATGVAPILLTDLTTNNNGENGLKIETLGAVTITALSTEKNTLDGLNILQSSGAAKPQTITLNNVTANQNSGDGIFIDAYGNIVVNKIVGIGNVSDGAVLINKDGVGTVTLLNALGKNMFIDNGAVGVYISSIKAVNVTGLDTLRNGNSGLVVINDTSSTSSAVTLNTVISRDNNGATGISVVSSGIVSISNSWASSNKATSSTSLSEGDGVYVKTDSDVKIINTSSINNDHRGIYVDSPAQLYLTNSTWFANLRKDTTGINRNLMWTGLTPIIA